MPHVSGHSPHGGSTGTTYGPAGMGSPPPKTHKEKVKAYLLSQSVKGTVILSPEGINGTIAGKKKI